MKTNTPGAELLKIEFGAILKEDAFSKWITSSWFPSALVDADAATILTGSRPVRTITKDKSISIVWEDFDKEAMKPVKVGSLEIVLDNSDKSPSLTVLRQSDGKNKLQGEDLLLDKLVEGINKNAYRKQFCVPPEESAE